jgi:DNA primase
LYNYWFAKNHLLSRHIAILVEGPGDVWRLREAGVDCGLALFGVQISDEQHFTLLRSGVHTVIALMDSDEAGRTATEILHDKLKRDFRMIFPNLETKDAGEATVEELGNLIHPLLRKAL